MSGREHQREANLRLVRRTVLVAVAMFGFGFLLVPLYSVVCDAFGLNGRFVDIQSGDYDQAAAKVRAGTARVDTSRTVTVQFVANRNGALNWEFRPLVRSMKVHPGKVYEVRYFARNLTGREVVGQAVPSLSPGEAVKYFTKIECFCFTRQDLKAREAQEMPLRFMVDPALPRDVRTITLAYTFFDTGDKPPAATAQAGRTSGG